MSSGEFLIIIVVALVVFGPTKLPMLAHHLAKLWHFAGECQQKVFNFWQSQLHEHQLQDNLKKAEKADSSYQRSEESSS